MAAPDLDLSRPGVINDDTGSWAKDNPVPESFFRGRNRLRAECVFGDLSRLVPSRAASLLSSLLPDVLARVSIRLAR